MIFQIVKFTVNLSLFTRIFHLFQVLLNDFFLIACLDDFIENARLFIFETFCRIHQCISISMLAEKLNMSPEEAERWIVNLIRNARLDAKIDSKQVNQKKLIFIGDRTRFCQNLSFQKLYSLCWSIPWVFNRVLSFDFYFFILLFYNYKGFRHLPS